VPKSARERGFSAGVAFCAAKAWLYLSQNAINFSFYKPLWINKTTNFYKSAGRLNFQKHFSMGFRSLNYEGNDREPSAKPYRGHRNGKKAKDDAKTNSALQNNSLQPQRYDLMIFHHVLLPNKERFIIRSALIRPPGSFPAPTLPASQWFPTWSGMIDKMLLD
jgi:hypothetical protein